MTESKGVGVITGGVTIATVVRNIDPNLAQTMNDIC